MTTSSNTLNYQLADWLSLHSLKLKEVESCLVAIRERNFKISKNFSETLQNREQSLGFTWVWKTVQDALIKAFPELKKQIEIVGSNSVLVIDASQDERPFTKVDGPDAIPLISMCYQERPSDALCVAHEFGHALQLLLVNGRFVPPLMREVAAFVAERAFLEYLAEETQAHFSEVANAWEADCSIYLRSDADDLSRALKSKCAKYDYRWNYPIARAVSAFAFQDIDHNELLQILRGRMSANRFISFILQFSKDFELENYLPPLLEASSLPAAIGAYQSLGMMALLDIDYWEGESELSIQDYYSARLRHMQEQSALVALGKDRRPVGYALWEADKNNDKVIHLKRQAAPFGDHLFLQTKLQKRLPENTTVLSHHARSAQQEQVAW